MTIERRDFVRPSDGTTFGRTHAVRLPECDYRGDIDIHAVICVKPDVSITADPRFATEVTNSITTCCKLLGFQLYGYCLMPDHLHILFSPRLGNHSLADWLLRFKSYTTRASWKYGIEGKLWQRSAYDHVCREENLETVLAYILDNPVRADLVQNWEEWPWRGVFIKI